MRAKYLLGLILCLLTVSGFAKTKPYYLIAGSGWNQVAILDKEAQQLVWTYTLDAGTECNCVDITKDGNVLIAYSKGAKLVSPADKQTIWDVKAPEKTELFTARALPDGGFLLAWCGSPAQITELDRDGKVRKEVRFDTGIPHAHGQFRQVSRLANGHYLVPLLGRGELLELDNNGTEIRRIKTGGNPYSVTVLKNKNWLVSGGDAHFMVEINPADGSVVNRIGQNDISGLSLQFVAETALADNRNLLITNWLGHSNIKDALKLAEVDQNHQVVWSVSESLPIPNVSAIKPIGKNKIKRVLNLK